MAVAYNAETSHASEWQFWPGRENAILRVQTSVGVYDAHPLSATGGAVKRRLITWKEMTASAGVYTSRDRAWLLPAANLPANVLPRPGDQVRDSDDVDWTIGDVSIGKFGQTYKCVCRALAVVNELSASGQLKRAPNAADTAGRPAFTYANQGGTVRCRVQPDDGQVEAVFDRLTIPRKYTAFLETPLTVQAHDQFVVGATTYTVLGFRNAEQVWDLMQLSLQAIP